MPEIARLKLRDLSRSVFDRLHRRPGRPAVIEDALPGANDWDMNRLQSGLGTQHFPARRYGSERLSAPRAEWQSYCDFVDVTLAQYRTLMSSGKAQIEGIYLAQLSLGRTKLGRELANAMHPLVATCGLSPLSDLNLWLGPPGHTEPLHYDPMDGTLVQIRGRKTITLYPPAQSANLYPFPLTGKIRPWFSQVDAIGDRETRFPRFGEARRNSLDATINAGDALFIPAGWWHEVTGESDDIVCSLNRFWKVRPLWRLLEIRLGTLLYAAFAARWMAGGTIRDPSRGVALQ